MRMLVTLEFADAGTKSGSHRVLIIGRGTADLQAGDIGLSLDEAKTLLSAIQDEFVSAQAAEIVEARRRCSSCSKKRNIKDWKLRRIHTVLGRVYLPSPRLRRLSATRHISTQRMADAVEQRITVSRSQAGQPTQL